MDYLTKGRSAQDPPGNPEIALTVFDNFPWEASPEAFSEVISDKNIGRTDKLSRSVLNYGSKAFEPNQTQRLLNGPLKRPIRSLAYQGHAISMRT